MKFRVAIIDWGRAGVCNPAMNRQRCAAMWRLVCHLSIVLFWACAVGTAFGQATSPGTTPKSAIPASTPPKSNDSPKTAAATNADSPGETGATKPTPPAEKDPSPAANATVLPGEIGPEVYLLPDSSGKLLAVPGFRYEDFIELYRLRHQLAGQNAEPDFVLSQVIMRGDAKADLARIAVELNLELNRSGWIKVPLGFSGAIVEKQPELEGAGRVILEYERQPMLPPPAGEGSGIKAAAMPAAGYVLWIKSDEKQTVRVKFPILSKVVAVGDESVLRLDTPLAGIAELTLNVPLGKAMVRVSDGVTLRSVTGDAATTTITAVGLQGVHELAWRLPGGPTLATPTKLEATGRIIAQIDGRSVNYDALLTVRGLGGQFERFQVRLPAGAQLISDKLTGATVSNVENGSGGPSNLIEVKLQKRTQGPVEVRLLADRPRSADNVDEPLELAGFEVLEAVRQWGHLGVKVVGDWQVIWGDTSGLRQVDEALEGKLDDGLLAIFEYASQPCSLSVRVSPRRTRIGVQPQYLFEVLPRETRLTAELKYSIRGAKVRELSVAMPGWEIEEIGPPNLVNVDAAAIDDAAKFSIPLAQPANGDLALTVKARRLLPPGIVEDSAQTLELEIPRPQAEVVSPAVVVVQAADNVELTPRSGSIVGLTLRSGRPPLASAGFQQDPLFYQADGPTARFVADFKVNPQRVDVRVETRVDIDELRMQVEQRLRYDVLYEPIEKLTLNVPRTIALEKLEILLDRTPLSPTLFNGEAAAETPDVLPVSVSLGSARLGRFDVSVRYTLPLETLPPATSIPVAVPLVLPVNAQLKEHRAIIRGESGISISVRKSGWLTDDRSRTLVERQEGLRLMTAEPLYSIDLALTLQERAAAATLIERGWIQTWFTDQGRQDRVIWRMVTSERSLRVALPAGTSPVGLFAALDGLPQQVTLDEQAQFTLPLPASAGQMQHLLELRYHIPVEVSAARAELSPPVLVPAAWARRVYWELNLPGQQHLLGEPAGFINESQWKWRRGYWERQPLLSSQDLARWIGVSPTENLQPTGTHAYLFSRVGEVPPLPLWLARRSHVVFAASLASLAAGLAVIHLRVFRRPLALFLLAMLVGIGGMISLDLTMLLLQAGLLGVLLAVVSLLFYRLAQPPPAGDESTAAAIAPVAENLRETPSEDQTATEMYYRAPGGSVVSTATAPLISPGASTEPI